MIMATSSGKCTGSLVVRLMLVLVVILAGMSSCWALVTLPPLPSVSVSLVKITFVNELTTPVKVTLDAPLLGTAPSTNIPPGEGRALPIELQGPLLGKGIYFQVGTQMFFAPGSEQSRILAETGTVTFNITGPCAYKQPGLQFVSTAALDVCTKLGCAALVKS